MGYSKGPFSTNRSKLSFELRRNLSRKQGWFGLLTIRSTNKIKINGLKNHLLPTENGSSCCCIPDSSFLCAPCVNEDKAYPITIAFKKNKRICEHGYLQSSFLYIDSEGELRARVHNRN